MRQINFAITAVVLTGILCSGCAHDPTAKTPAATTAPTADPRLVGTWFEQSQLAGGKWAEPSEPIQQLRFDHDGSFSVTWHPFESYMDYWGHYSLLPETGQIVLTIDGGNYVPADFAGKGAYTVDEQGRLTLSGICLGTPRDVEPTPPQAARFERLQP